MFYINRVGKYLSKQSTFKPYSNSGSLCQKNATTSFISHCMFYTGVTKVIKQVKLRHCGVVCRIRRIVGTKDRFVKIEAYAVMKVLGLTTTSGWWGERGGGGQQKACGDIHVLSSFNNQQ